MYLKSTFCFQKRHKKSSIFHSSNIILNIFNSSMPYFPTRCQSLIRSSFLSYGKEIFPTLSKTFYSFIHNNFLLTSDSHCFCLLSLYLVFFLVCANILRTSTSIKWETQLSPAAASTFTCHDDGRAIVSKRWNFCCNTIIVIDDSKSTSE